MNKKERMNEGKIFWGILAVAVVLLISGLTSPTLSGAVAGKAIQTISIQPAGGELLIETTNVKGVKDVSFHFIEDIHKITVKVEETTNQKFDGIIYSQFKVSSTDDEKIGTLDFNLKIKEKDIIDLGLTVEEFAVYFNGQELALTLDRIEGYYVYYTFSHDQFGDYIVGCCTDRHVNALTIQERAQEDIEAKKEIEENKAQGKLPEYKPEVQEPAPVVGDAIEQPTPETPPAPEKENFFSKIKNFFKNLFK